MYRLNMVLTRRLYELEEVKAAFRVCLRMCRVQEALYWLEELELSCEDALAKHILLELWVMRKGILWWSWLFAWATYGDSCAGRRSLVKCFCGHEKQKLDSSLWLAYWLGLWEDTSSIGDLTDTQKVVLNALTSDTSSKHALEQCVLWWFLRLVVVNPSRITPLHLDPEEWSLEDAEDALKKKGIRASRLFEIPFTAHLGWTSRGFDTRTRISRTDLYTLLAHPLWAGHLEGYVSEDYEWKSDAMKEEFYDTYFGAIGDIPDEWGKKEKEKSHGLPPSRRTCFRLNHWWKQWIPEEHLYVFGEPLRRLQKELESDFTIPIEDILENKHVDKKHIERLCGKMRRIIFDD